MFESAATNPLIMKQKILGLIFIILLIVLTIESIRRKSLREKYAVLWLVAAFAIFPLVLWSGLVEFVAGLAGIASPPSAILLTAILFIIFILFQFSIELSSLSRNLARLMIRVIELEEKIDRLAPPPPNPKDATGKRKSKDREPE